MSILEIIELIIGVLLIFILMNFLYKRNNNNAMKKYLLQFDVLEKEVLKAILTNKEKNFPLTKTSPITQKFVHLKILFKLKDDEKNPLHSIYYLNLAIFNLITKDSQLKEIYLS